ncbi:MAG: hypothetical protein RIT81_20250 [Deltaproteobacteria bacterium]
MTKTNHRRITTHLLGLAAVGTLAFTALACERKSDIEKAAELMEDVHEDKTERAAKTQEDLRELRTAVVYDDREAELFSLEKRLEAIDDRAEASKLDERDAAHFERLEDATEDVLEALNARDDDYEAKAARIAENLERLEALVDRAS